MSKRGFYCAIAAGVVSVMLAGSAEASVFSLQLGSFDKEDLATQKWNALKAAYPDVLQGLNLKVVETTLQPENATVYRTQAGPIGDKATAQALCGKLLAKGEDCLVAETAFFNDSGSSVALVAPPAAPDPFSPPSETALTPAAPEAQAMSAALPPALPPVSAAAPSAEPMTPPPAAEAMILPPSPPPAPAAPMASAAQPLMAPPAAPTPAAEAAPSWRSRMTSWLPKLPDTGVSTANDTPWKRKDGALAKQEIAATPSRTPLATRAPAPAAPAHEALPPPAIVAEEAPAPEARMQAPTPSLPPVMPAAPQPLMAPPPSPPAALPPSPFVTSTAPTAARVNVAEAVRVPLSTRRGTAGAIYAQDPLSYRAMPSQDLGFRTFWAQIGSFADMQAALSFWQGVASAHPEWPSTLRTRIVRPYSSRGRTSRAVSLRVGPFGKIAQVGDVCRAVLGSGLSCSGVADLGSSAPVSTIRRREDAGDRQYRYEMRRAMSRSGAMSGGMFWAQLGTYNSSSDAMREWMRLEGENSDVMRHLQSNITTPPMGSTPQPFYRLRTGPFATPHAAEDLCRKLARRSIPCRVVNGL